ncbi:MAG: class I SAM-dependent methyltransferase [Acidobacteriaceae bacterium]|nr:class I SAM-dependent methyltransferase [Acidobacteriaceae bacterium]MBV9295758.1 class I SAM-dependent methyltransferase [Acidobacteriaceae bacterium]MBV9767317.1 class I SAM-dependent methyltransferase [Acidobacteriaceae bacterium]
MRLFEQTFQISSRTRVLDVGGSPLIWQFAKVQPNLTFLNLPAALQKSSNGAHQVAGDGRMLPFRDGSFDIVFSNSVIEHVGDAVSQQRFAQEIARVGQRYWVQTPNRRFPVEHHLMLPFIHYLPKGWQRPIVSRLTIWELLVQPSEDQRAFYVKHFLDELNLLDSRELQTLFPDSKILAERLLGFPKSLIAVRA